MASNGGRSVPTRKEQRLDLQNAESPSSTGWNLVSLPSEVVAEELSLSVDNADGHVTTEDSSSDLVAKKGSTTVVCAIHSLA